MKLSSVQIWGWFAKVSHFFFNVLHIKSRHLAAIFKVPTSPELYSEKSHVLYMVMLSGIGILVHSMELATWNPTGNGLGGNIAFCMNLAVFPSDVLDWFKRWPWREPELWNQGSFVPVKHSWIHPGSYLTCSFYQKQCLFLVLWLLISTVHLTHRDSFRVHQWMPGSHARPIGPEPQGDSSAFTMLRECTTNSEVQLRLRNMASVSWAVT